MTPDYGKTAPYVAHWFKAHAASGEQSARLAKRYHLASALTGFKRPVTILSRQLLQVVGVHGDTSEFHEREFTVALLLLWS